MFPFPSSQPPSFIFFYHWSEKVAHTQKSCSLNISTFQKYIDLKISAWLDFWRADWQLKWPAKETDKTEDDSPIGASWEPLIKNSLMLYEY